ncbi:MAG: diguanylate cyclase [Tissierellales bacterium]|nr:diguanylate cyclase [Tissierellales bacterium]
MVKILFYLDKENRIQRVSSNSTDVCIEIGMDVLTFFPEITQENLLKTINICRLSEDAMDLTTQIEVSNKNVPVSVFVSSLNREIMILILDNAAMDLSSYKKCLKVQNELINTVREEMRKATRDYSVIENESFEEIQKLNSELINTKRQLQRANNQLQQQKAYLEGRLIKDALTGLVSRYQYWDEIEKLIANDSECYGVFVFMDLDGFKAVNDTYGHSAGDRFLVEIAQRLEKVDFPFSIKIRIAGDEFGLYVHKINRIDDDYFENLWQVIYNEVIGVPININGILMTPSISCGMSVYGKDSRNIGELIEYADYAMYRSKYDGKGKYTLFNKEIYKKSKSKDERKLELERIIRDKDFHHVFQPFYSAKTDEIAGYSAKLRVCSDSFFSTKELIEFAYEMNLYRELDKVSLQQLTLNHNLHQIIGEKYLVVTHGPYPLSNDVISGICIECLKDIKLIMEIWMPANIHPLEMQRIKDKSQEIGACISIANFGTHHSNDLFMLSTGPDFIRLSSNLVRMAKKDEASKQILLNILSYCRLQGTKVIGDFIETYEDYQFFKEMEVDYLQGFYFDAIS